MTTKGKRPTNSLSENIAVPNGTTKDAIVSDETPLASINEPVVSYIERFKSFGKASAEGIIEQCRTIVLAEDELAPRYFKRFCDELRISAPTLRKWKKIGQEADRLLSAGDRLPNNWTTLYLLANKEKAAFYRLLETGKLHPAITAQELRDENSERKAPQIRYSMEVDLGSTEVGVRLEVLSKVEELCATYGVKLKQSKSLSAFVENFKGQGVSSSMSQSAT